MATAAAQVRARWTSERKFYTAMAVAMFTAAYVGFARSFFLRPFFPDWPSPHEPLIYVHGALFSSWCALLVAQACFVGVGRTDVHRRVGAGGAALAACMVVFGVLAAVTAARRPGGFVTVPVPPLQFLIVPLSDMLLFGTFVTVAVLRRRDPQAHKRWMLLATTSLLGAAFARWPAIHDTGNPLIYFGCAYLFVVALAAWDLRSRGRLHRATVVGGALLLVSVPLRLALSGTAAWLAFATWATGLGH
jgi:uncharacterized membrane protein YozB (DUF420 family)